MIQSTGAELSDRAPQAPWSFTWLAGIVPAAYYVATASAHSHWLDASEFVAAARLLGVTHPPGHPLDAIVSALFALLPVGPLSFRVAVGSGVLAGIAIAFVFRAIFHTLVGIGARDERTSTALALGAAWIVAGGTGFWLQAVRPEVYALQAALSAIVLDAIVRFEMSQPSDDLRPLYVASFVEGLALANHHFLALLLLPVAAPTLGRIFARRGFISLFGMLAAPLMGLATYVYLPIRAGQEPPLNLGDPSTIPRLLWVVSAQAFHKNTGSGVPLPADERVLDVVAGLVDSLGFVVLFMALAGLYTTLRMPRARRFGLLWAIAAGVTISARAFLGFTRNNPDALGYLAVGYFALVTLAACFVSQMLGVFGAEARTVRLLRATTYGLCALTLVRLTSNAEAESLRTFEATDAMDDLTRRKLPTRAIVLAHNPTTIFQHFGAEAEEHLRPDVTLVPIPFLTYPGMVDALIAEAPELKPLLRGYLLDGQLSRSLLQSLAASRPVLVELDLRVRPELFDTLVPEGALYRVLPDGMTAGDEHVGMLRQRKAYEVLYARLGRAVDAPQTREQLLYRHYLDALYYAHIGDRTAARASVALGLARQPLSKELSALAKELSDAHSEGPLDIMPFLPAI